MKKGRSKSKGNKYELKIARKFSRWYSPHDKDDYFWRTAGSGAKATITKRAEPSFVGDIYFTPNPDLLLPVLEVKDRKKVTFNNVNTEAFLPTVYYKETVEKAKELGIDRPVWIIFKIHRHETDYIYLNKKAWEIPWKTDPPYPSINEVIKPAYLNFALSTKEFIILALEEFLSVIPRVFILGEENNGL